MWRLGRASVPVPSIIPWICQQVLSGRTFLKPLHVPFQVKGGIEETMSSPAPLPFLGLSTFGAGGPGSPTGHPGVPFWVF